MQNGPSASMREPQLRAPVSVRRDSASRSSRRRPRWWLACALLACFTVELWGGDPDELVLTDELAWHIDRPEEALPVDAWWELLYKVPLTPVTLLLDVVTFPVQMFVVGKDEAR